MKILTEQQCIALVNKYISQQGLGPEYSVKKVREAKWGYLMYWLPPGAEKSIAGSGPYLCHRNGCVREWAETAHKHNLHPINQQQEVVAAFVREAETRIRQ